MAGQALKNTDRSDYLFTRSTQSALTLAKRVRDVRDEVQPEWVFRSPAWINVQRPTAVSGGRCDTGPC